MRVTDPGAVIVTRLGRSQRSKHMKIKVMTIQLGPQVVTNRTVRDRCVGPGITGFRLAMGSALGFLPSD